MKPSLLLFLLCLQACGGTPGGGAQHRAAHAEGAAHPDWQPWQAATFDRARAEQKPILLSVQAGWCHWCHVMNDTTYRSRKVLELLNTHYVVIKVDSDARPDIARRFMRWGWPATIVLSPDAEFIAARRGHQPEKKFVSFLTAMRTASPGVGTADNTQETSQTDGVQSDITSTKERIAQRLMQVYDEAQGGFGAQKYPFPRLLEALMLRGLFGRKRDIARAKTTLEGHMQLIDPMDGGMYQYSVKGVWDRPHFERIAAIQAGAIANFSQAYRYFGDPRYLEAADAVTSYALNTLQAPDGGFYASQDADLGTYAGQKMSGAQYFSLDRNARAKAGVPHIDKHIYTDLSALLIAALAERSMAGPHTEARMAAERAADRLMGTRLDEQGLLRHEESDHDPRRYLSDQAQMARALYALYVATGDGHRLEQTRALIVAMKRALWDSNGGGFYERTRDAADRGVFAERTKPQADNAVAAQVLLAIGQLGAWTDGVELAHATVGAITNDSMIASQGRYLGELWVTFEKLTRPYAIASVVGPANNDATERLLEAARHWPYPLRHVEHGLPGASRYPYPGRPAVYVCDQSACSAPSYDEKTFLDAANAFVEVGG